MQQLSTWCIYRITLSRGTGLNVAFELNGNHKLFHFGHGQVDWSTGEQYTVYIQVAWHFPEKKKSRILLPTVFQMYYSGAWSRISLAPQTLMW